MFRAKNPYDAVPLPYVMGTKKWQEHKYAGLYDSAENSEDEQPEQFSSSSSDEQEVPAQKATSLPQMPQSDSSSLASLPRDPPVVAPPAPVTLQPPYPTVVEGRLQPPNPTVVEAAPRTKAQPRPIISSQRNPHEHNFAALRESPPSDDPPSTSSSLNSSAAAGGLPRVDASLSSSSSSASKPVPAVRRQTPPKLFDDDITISAAPPDPAAVAIPVDIPAPENEVKPVAAASQIKRKPVNLFNDDEFHSFMSEIVDKVQSKSGNSVKSPERIKETPKKTVEEPPKQRQTVPKETEPPQRKLNLFDDSPPVSPVPKPVAVAATPSKVPPKTLFDDNLDDDVDDFLSSFTPKAKPAQQQQPPKTSLFDDDDDDLDIDDIFAKKTPTTNKLSNKFVGKTSLFDDDDEEDNANDIFATTSKAKVVSKQQPEVATVEPPNVQRKSLFDDLGDDDLFGTPKSNKNVFADEQKQDVQRTLGQFVEKEEPPVDTPLLKQQPEKIVRDEPQQLAVKAEIIPARKPEKANLFSDDFSDEEEPVEVSIRDTATSEKPKEIIAEAQPSAPAKPANKVEEEEVVNQEEDEVLDNLQPKDSSNLKEAAPERVPSPAAQEEATRTTDKEVVEAEPAACSVAEETAPPAAEVEVPSATDKAASPVAEKEASPAAEEEAPPAAEHEAAPVESDDEEDPILTMVADLSSKQKQLQSEGETAAPQPQIMQMFFDEPPDDSEFFQSLGTSSLNSLSASKMFDSAHDFFEPSLPDLPKATTTSNSAAVAEQQAGKEYGGLRLFSDVPPDDDEDENMPQQSIPTTANASTKRIHTIFYDDFSETARAGEVEQTKMPPSKLPIFDEEPPVDVVDKSIASQPELPKPSSPVKKLQMPNIQINVHALLPGAAGRPKFAKKQEEDQEKEQEEQEQEMPKQEEDDQLKASVIPSKTVSNDTENILQCLGKTRTRGPARRPSTRRARRENYAKALLEEQSVTPTDQANDEAPQKTSQPVLAAVVKETPAKKEFVSFLDGNDDEEDALFPAAKPPAKETPKESLKATKQLPAVSAAPVPVALLPSQPPEDKVKSKSAASFLDSDEDDESDALFSPAGTQHTQQSKPVVSFLEDEASAPLTAAAPASIVNAQQAAPAPVNFVSQKPPEDVFKPRVSSFLDSDEDDDDALFGAVRKSVPASPSAPATVAPSNSSGAVAVSTPSTAAPTPAVVNKSQQKVPAKVVSFLDTDDEDDDALFSPVRRTGTGTPKVPVSNPAPAAASVPAAARAPAAASVPPAARGPATVPAPAAVSTLPSTPAALPALISNPAKPKASKLFDDSDDDDDLFGTPSAPVLKTKSAPAVATPKSVPAPVSAPVAAASSSLFASDSEEEQKPTPKATTISRAKQPAKSLFSDDEDDDDLFGSGAGAAAKRAAPRPQVKSIQAPKPKVAASVKITTTMPKPSAGTADNPLADLLDP